ncbi:unnamed protein product [Didymodactylos carnosus]|uniref:Uncharacterized protein n=1 Tax=Didymodactylos carnosus TaxID=1234261 RepID=A0A816A9C2_9BILA|nr:unnamed protein product [Didymodactylos carnosus]CAF4465598.1 unnamed protein product [Didymodactylos carnosus]
MSATSSTAAMIIKKRTKRKRKTKILSAQTCETTTTPADEQQRSCSKNDSCNNKVFSVDRYDETIEIVASAKLKQFCDRTQHEIAVLRTYDVVTSGSKQKLVKTLQSTNGLILQYYVAIDEIYEVIKEAHEATGYRGLKKYSY